MGTHNFLKYQDWIWNEINIGVTLEVMLIFNSKMEDVNSYDEENSNKKIVVDKENGNFD